MIEKSCCFTGHRRLPPEHLQSITKQLNSYITELIDSGVRRFIAGGALGFDTLAANEVLKLKSTYCPEIRLVLALPCRNQDRYWTPLDKVEYARILECADEVIYVSEKYTPYCMHARNRYMVDNAAHCIAYLNQASGGTAYTVNYARQSGREVKIIK